MGNTRAGAGGGTTLRNEAQRGGAALDGLEAQGAAQDQPRHRRSGADRKSVRLRRRRKVLLVSAVLFAGFVVGLIGGMISGVA